MYIIRTAETGRDRARQGAVLTCPPRHGQRRASESALHPQVRVTQWESEANVGGLLGRSGSLVNNLLIPLNNLLRISKDFKDARGRSSVLGRVRTLLVRPKLRTLEVKEERRVT